MDQRRYEYRLLDYKFNDGMLLRPDNLTVFVGPNNSGKSRSLKEIAAFTCQPHPPRGVVVSAVNVEYPSTLEEFRRAYDVERHLDENGNWSFRSLGADLSQEFQVSGAIWPTPYEEQFRKMQEKPERFSSYFAEQFGRAMVAFLTTESRLQLVRVGPSPSHYRQSSSLLQHLYNAGTQAERVVSDLVKQTFGKAVALDFTVPQTLLLRVGDDFSGLPADPRDARALMQNNEMLDNQGDGIRSFVGIIIALLTLKRGLFLIDEPEAFLHPPQAFRIGALIADQSNKSRQIIIATHSADVLRGILSRTRDVDIVRIDRVGNTNYFSHLDAQRLKDIINDPLLCSARVLDGLFYAGAGVVEADSDARFYHAASIKRSRMLDLHFVNADNKQTVPKIVSLYRYMGVRSAGIVDFDVLNDRAELEKSLQTLGIGDEDLPPLLEAQRQIGQVAKEHPASERLGGVQIKLAEIQAKVDEIVQQPYSSAEEEQRTKNALLRQLESRFKELSESTKAWKALTQAGRAALPPTAQTAFDTISTACAARGLFVNPAGELESMLTEYGIPATTDKRGWITRALQLVPSLEPDDAKNPWKFLKAVHEHLQPT